MALRALRFGKNRLRNGDLIRLAKSFLDSSPI
jgi:hypothetical protein